MDNFSEQFTQELNYQEIKSNKYTFKGFICFIIGITVVWILTMTSFFLINKRLVTIVFIANIVLFLLALWIRLTMDLSKRWIKYTLLTMISIGTGIIGALLSFHAVLIYILPLLFAIQYRRKNIIWFVFVVNTVSMLLSSFAGFYYGICDLNLLFVSQHVRDWYIALNDSNMLVLPLNSNPNYIIVVFEVFPRSLILFLFSIIMQYTIVNSNEDAHRIAQLTYLKETDLVTRVFNKNKYEEMIYEYYPKINQIAVLFWDLNNLKLINDQYGHAMGDTIIEKLASVLSSYSNERCRVYRIGGDEFLLIIDEPHPSEADELVVAIRKRLDSIERTNSFCISSAVGYASGCGKNILEVIKEADANMYQDKKRQKEISK